MGSVWSDTERHLCGGDRWKRVGVCMLRKGDRRILGFSPFLLPGAHWLISTVQIMSWCATVAERRLGIWLFAGYRHLNKAEVAAHCVFFYIKLNVLCNTV